MDRHCCWALFACFGFQQFFPTPEITGGCKAGKFFEGGRKRIPIIKTAFQRDTLEIESPDKALLDELFTMPYPITIEKVMEMQPDFPVEKIRELVSGNVQVLGEVPETVSDLKKGLLLPHQVIQHVRDQYDLFPRQGIHSIDFSKTVRSRQNPFSDQVLPRQADCVLKLHHPIKQFFPGMPTFINPCNPPPSPLDHLQPLFLQPLIQHAQHLAFYRLYPAYIVDPHQHGHISRSLRRAIDQDMRFVFRRKPRLIR
jgi:hypothetical protein